MARTFYRILAGASATRGDFLSHEALGRPLRRATSETRRTYDGVSIFETANQARAVVKRAARYRLLGTHIAAVTIPEDSPIRVRRTFLDQPGHYTVWGDPDDLLRCVTRIEPVAKPDEEQE